MTNSPDRHPATTGPGTGTAEQAEAPAWEAEAAGVAGPGGAGGARVAAPHLRRAGGAVVRARLGRRAGHQRRVAATGCSARSSRWAPVSPTAACPAPCSTPGCGLALILYCGVLLGARRLGAARRRRLRSSARTSCSPLAPPLLSQDVFSYIAYARLDVVHDLNPYTHSPADVPADPVFPFAGSKDFTSVYGPLFTVATFPLAKTSVPFAFWTLKAIAALASLGVVALVWQCARRLGRDPRLPALAVGLNPLVLVHVVGGAHNDALTVLLWMGGVAALIAARPPREAAGGRADGRIGCGEGVRRARRAVHAHRRAPPLGTRRRRGRGRRSAWRSWL